MEGKWKERKGGGIEVEKEEEKNWNRRSGK
jgi:hypothetical protein